MADGDADQTTGATGDASPQEKGDSGDADPQETGATEGTSEPVPQRVYDKAYAEARQTFQSELEERDSRIQDLESTIDDLKGDEDGRKSPEDRSDVYTEEQVEEVKKSLRSEIEKRESAIESANAAMATARLTEALRQQNVVKPEYFAKLMVAEGRVQADVTEGLDHLKVLTDQGTKMMTQSGEEATVNDLAARWAENNPELVRDGQQNGAGFDEGSEPRPTSLTDKQRKAEQEGNLEEAGRAKAARALSAG